MHENDRIFSAGMMQGGYASTSEHDVRTFRNAADTHFFHSPIVSAEIERLVQFQ